MLQSYLAHLRSACDASRHYIQYRPMEAYVDERDLVGRARNNLRLAPAFDCLAYDDIILLSLQTFTNEGTGTTTQGFRWFWYPTNSAIRSQCFSARSSSIDCVGEESFVWRRVAAEDVLSCIPRLESCSICLCRRLPNSSVSEKFSRSPKYLTATRLVLEILPI